MHATSHPSALMSFSASQPLYRSATRMIPSAMPSCRCHCQPRMRPKCKISSSYSKHRIAFNPHVCKPQLQLKRAVRQDIRALCLQTGLYTAILESKAVAMLLTTSSAASSSVLPIITKLRKLCNSPALLHESLASEDAAGIAELYPSDFDACSPDSSGASGVVPATHIMLDRMPCQSGCGPKRLTDTFIVN